MHTHCAWKNAPTLVIRIFKRARMKLVQFRCKASEHFQKIMSVFNFSCPFVLSCFIKTRLAPAIQHRFISARNALPAAARAPVDYTTLTQLPQHPVVCWYYSSSNLCTETVTDSRALYPFCSYTNFNRNFVFLIAWSHCLQVDVIASFSSVYFGGELK